MNKKLQIGLIGSAGADEYPEGKGISNDNLFTAEAIGAELARNNCIVITGGKGGIMEAAARGAKEAGGITIGVITGKKRFTSNDFTDIEVISGAGAAGLDEFNLVMMCDALIIIGGGAGTLQEITIAYRNAKPIFAMMGTGGWADKVANTFLDERETVKIEGTHDIIGTIEKIISLIKK